MRGNGKTVGTALRKLELPLVALGLVLAAGWLPLRAGVLLQGYSDPGSGALMLQVLAASCIGMLFYFRRAITWVVLRRQGKTNSAATERRPSPAAGNGDAPND